MKCSVFHCKRRVFFFALCVILILTPYTYCMSRRNFFGRKQLWV